MSLCTGASATVAVRPPSPVRCGPVRSCLPVARYRSVSMWRRRRLPEQYHRPFAAFSAQAERVEAARSALLSCLPVGRVDPAPVPVGLDLVDDELRAVDAELEIWWVQAVDAEWQACRRALHTALEAVPHARVVARETGELEELLDAVGEVVEPLDDWQAAERRWAALRTR